MSKSKPLGSNLSLLFEISRYSIQLRAVDVGTGLAPGQELGTLLCAMDTYSGVNHLLFVFNSQ